MVIHNSHWILTTPPGLFLIWFLIINSNFRFFSSIITSTKLIARLERSIISTQKQQDRLKIRSLLVQKKKRLKIKFYNWCKDSLFHSFSINIPLQIFTILVSIIFNVNNNIKITHILKIGFELKKKMNLKL